MDSIERLPNATAASTQASLLAVTVEDVCRILSRHAIDHCRHVFGTSRGRISLSADYATWTITVTFELDHASQLSSHEHAEAGLSEDHELELLSHLGLLHITSTTSSETTVCIWQDGQKSQSELPSTSVITPPPSNTTLSGRGVTIALRDVFCGMPIRRKYIASEAAKKSQLDSLIHCVRELSLLVPETNLQLSVRHATRSDGTTPISKTLLSLPRARDVVHRCLAAFGTDSIELDTVHKVSAEHTYDSVRMKVNGFFCPTLTSIAPQIIFFQGRTWPKSISQGAPQQSERDSAAFVSLLSAFGLGWTHEPATRHTRKSALSSDLYKEVCQRIAALPGAPVCDKGSQASYAFVLNVTLTLMAQDDQDDTRLDGQTKLTVVSFQRALLDAICSEPSTSVPSTPHKRKRISRPTSAIEFGVDGDIVSPLRSRPATAALAIDSYGASAAAPEGMVEWRDPMNGRLFHIDQRTGHSIAVSPGLARVGDGDMPLETRAHTSRRRGIVNRSHLTKGLNASPSKARATPELDAASNSEFDDPDLDAALASIPSPSPAASAVSARHSRFFDSRRPESPTKLNNLRSVRPEETEDIATRPNTGDLEQAITRTDLQEATVLDQVDGKFILCSTASSSERNAVLFCIDQHAADERYRLERLVEAYVSDCLTGTSAHTLRYTFTLSITTKQCELILDGKGVREGLERLGWSVKEAVVIHVALSHAQVDLSGIPYILKEKALADSGRVKDKELLYSTFSSCLEALAAPPSPIASAIAGDEGDWLSLSRSIPTSLMDVMKSTACRSAIMFNDPLSKEAAERVVRRLGECKFPFSCAHGRPSLVPLCEVKTTQRDLWE